MVGRIGALDVYEKELEHVSAMPGVVLCPMVQVRSATVDDNLEAQHLHQSADTGFSDHLGPMYHLNVKLMKIMKTIHKTHRDHLTFTCAKDSPMCTPLKVMFTTSKYVMSHNEKVNVLLI